MSHDFNLALLLMNEQLPVTLQATGRDTYGIGVWDSAVCNLQYPGGKTIFIDVCSGVHVISRNKVSRIGDDKLVNSVRLIVDGQFVERGKEGYSCFAERFFVLCIINLTLVDMKVLFVHKWSISRALLLEKK